MFRRSSKGAWGTRKGSQVALQCLSISSSQKPTRTSVCTSIRAARLPSRSTRKRVVAAASVELPPGVVTDVGSPMPTSCPSRCASSSRGATSAVSVYLGLVRPARGRPPARHAADRGARPSARPRSASRRPRRSPCRSTRRSSTRPSSARRSPRARARACRWCSPPLAAGPSRARRRRQCRRPEAARASSSSRSRSSARSASPPRRTRPRDSTSTSARRTRSWRSRSATPACSPAPRRSPARGWSSTCGCCSATTPASPAPVRSPRWSCPAPAPTERSRSRPGRPGRASGPLRRTARQARGRRGRRGRSASPDPGDRPRARSVRMKRLNLLPAELRPREGGRHGSAYLVVGALLASVVAMLVLLDGHGGVHNDEAELGLAQGRDAPAQARADALRPYGEFAAMKDQREVRARPSPAPASTTSASRASSRASFPKECGSATSTSRPRRRSSRSSRPAPIRRPGHGRRRHRR